MQTVAKALLEESIPARVTLIEEGLISRKFFYIIAGQVQVIVSAPPTRRSADPQHVRWQCVGKQPLHTVASDRCG
jgi:hypothetical protein